MAAATAAVGAKKKKPNKFIQMRIAKSDNCKKGTAASQAKLDKAIETYETSAKAKGKTAKEIATVTKPYKSKSCAAVSGVRKKKTAKKY